MEIKIAIVAIFLFNAPLSKGVTVEFLGIVECENKTESDFSISVEVQGDPKTGKGKIHLPVDVKADDRFHVDVHKYVEDKWSLFIREADGDICAKMEEIFPTAWEKIRAKTTPEVPDECKISAGNYEFSDVLLESEDVECPNGVVGIFRMDATTIIDGKPAFCLGFHLDIKP